MNEDRPLDLAMNPTPMEPMRVPDWTAKQWAAFYAELIELAKK
jgi:hypothetical protein